MKLAAGCAPEPAQQVGLHPDLFCSANDLPALGVSDFESPFAYGTDDGFFTPNEKYSIHCCRMFHNVILLSLILGTTLRNINLAGVSSYCGVFYFTSIPVSRIGFILTGILADYLRQNKRSKVPAPGQCQGAAWRQVGLAETLHHAKSARIRPSDYMLLHFYHTPYHLRNQQNAPFYAISMISGQINFTILLSNET